MSELGQVLVLAPHLEYPARIGDDILIDGRWGAISLHSLRVDILGANGFYRDENGTRQTIFRLANRRRSRLGAAFRTLVLRSHYLREAHLTARYWSRAIELLQGDTAYDVVVASYYFTAELGLREFLKPSRDWMPRMLVYESHNDELQWYEIMRAQTRNPLVRMVAR